MSDRENRGPSGPRPAPAPLPPPTRTEAALESIAQSLGMKPRIESAWLPMTDEEIEGLRDNYPSNIVQRLIATIDEMKKEVP